MSDLGKKGIVTLSIAILGFNPVIIRTCSLETPVLMFYRLCFSLIFFGLLMIWKDRGKSLSALSWRERVETIIVGMLFATQAVLYIYAIRGTSVANALILINSASVYVVFVERFILKRRLSNISIIASLVAFLGCVILSLGEASGGGNIYGDLCAWAGAIIFALYVLGAKKRSSAAPVYVNMFLMGIGGVLMFTVLCMVQGMPLIGYPLSEIGLALASAVAGIMIPHGVSNWAMKTVSASFVATIFLVEPIAGTLFAYVLYDELLKSTQIIGGLMVILGLVWYNVYETKRSLPAEDRIE